MLYIQESSCIHLINRDLTRVWTATYHWCKNAHTHKSLSLSRSLSLFPSQRVMLQDSLQVSWSPTFTSSLLWLDSTNHEAQAYFIFHRTRVIQILSKGIFCDMELAKKFAVQAYSSVLASRMANRFLKWRSLVQIQLSCSNVGSVFGVRNSSFRVEYFKAKGWEARALRSFRIIFVSMWSLWKRATDWVRILFC